MCNCQKKGLGHWWKYLRLRYHWRNFWRRMDFGHGEVNGQEVWVERSWTFFGSIPTVRIYNQYPGPCMTLDEYKHWFPHTSV